MPGQTVTTLSEESIGAHRNWLIARGRSANTAKAYSSDLREFLKAIGETSISMDEFEDLAMSWLNLTRTTAAPKTTGRRLTTLKQFAKWAGLEVLADYSPPTPGPSAPHPIPEGPEGVDRMIRAATNCRQQALVALCGFAGLRVAEALSIRTSDFDLQDMTLSIRGKGDKTRTVPVSNRCWSGIAAAFVIAETEREQRLVAYQDRAARQIITTLGKRAGLARRVTSHDLRATFATAVYDATLDIRVTQQLLGHESVETTQLYTGISQEKMQKAVDF